MEIRKRVWRGDQPRRAYRQRDGADAVRPFGMCRASGVVDESPAGNKPDHADSLAASHGCVKQVGPQRTEAARTPLLRRSDVLVAFRERRAYGERDAVGAPLPCRNGVLAAFRERCAYRVLTRWRH